MAEITDKIIAFAKDKPILVGVGAIGVVGVAFLMKKDAPKETADGEQTADSETSPLYGVNGSPLLSSYTGANVPVIANYNPTLPGPGEQSNPGTSLTTLVRNGKAIKVTAGPPGICPSGYVAAQQKGQPVRCTLVNDAKQKPGQRLNYVPSQGKSPYATN